MLLLGVDCVKKTSVKLRRFRNRSYICYIRAVILVFHNVVVRARNNGVIKFFYKGKLK